MRNMEKTYSKEENNVANISLNTKIFLLALRIKLHGTKKEMIVRAALDTCSDRSYILGKALNEFGFDSVVRQNLVFYYLVESIRSHGSTKPIEST